MQLFNILSVIFLAASALAHIVSITAPATVKAGTKFTVTFATQNGPINFADDFVLFGFTTNPSTNSLGNPAGSFDLITQGHSTSLGSFTESIKAVSTPGTYTLTAIVTSVLGAAYNVELRQFSTNITVT